LPQPKGTASVHQHNFTHPPGLVELRFEAEKKFRRIKGYQEILLLKERLNPSRIQQKEVRTVEVA
jgi:hypothetical protein